jgi:hypothetical protein
MFKKIIFTVMAILLSVAVNAQEWISFGNRAAGAPPETSLQQNDNQQVLFTVSLSGMYAESKSETSGVYKRLSMPECSVAGDVGAPEIPVITKMIAVPECSSIQYSIIMSGVQTFSNYTVYPVPEQQGRTDDDSNIFFVKNICKYE